jgi:hypothetical protein
MPETNTREVAEAEFDRHRKSDAKMNGALKLEAARHAAIVENMSRLKVLRLARNEKLSPEKPSAPDGNDVRPNVEGARLSSVGWAAHQLEAGLQPASSGNPQSHQVRDSAGVNFH